MIVKYVFTINICFTRSIEVRALPKWKQLIAMKTCAHLDGLMASTYDTHVRAHVHMQRRAADCISPRA